MQKRQIPLKKHSYIKEPMMTDTFEEHSYMEEPMIPETEVKATQKVLRTSKSLRLYVILMGLFQATETGSVNILTMIF